MDAFFSFFILGIPGVLTYLITKGLGTSTSNQQSNTELVAITSLLWIPTILVSILLFNLLYFFSDLILTATNIAYFSKFDITYINSISTLKDNIDPFIFIFFFSIIMIISSIAVSIIAPSIYSIFIHLVNNIRLKKKHAKISPGISVWHKFFILKNDEQPSEANNEQSLLVQMHYLDDKTNPIYGSLTFIPADDKQKKQFIIAYKNEWTELIEELHHIKGNFSVPISRTFFDADSRLVVNEIDRIKLDEIIEEVNR
ncbi:hypothetical protein MUN88_10540 [Gracilibacillus caseinilyticus]|uniref:Uncharacterized protein n=1 Tax=Gracilibacillus caseinilyticus TaxID=2932256 RepID=A0ABY4F191_9BACI|nr:hypothetical protein [Gracilibacillus caseinilyticus]UOQ50453.1 hypothetical protein MUN88_10540 [Gracilibacillus caseinilyticus]